MERPLLQLVTSHPATNKKLFPRRAPDWAQDISELSNAQLRSCHAFAQYGVNQLEGVTGTTEYQGRTISKSAMKVATDYPATGQGAFDGDSPQERRQERREKAQASIDALQREMESRPNMNNRGTSRIRSDGGEPRTDGGQTQEN